MSYKLEATRLIRKKHDLVKQIDRLNDELEDLEYQLKRFRGLKVYHKRSQKTLGGQ